MNSTITVAIAGNPNAGKTTLFNRLTGTRQHVGNYPGVTVEKKEGTYEHKGVKLHIVDLPGTYSLTAYSLEEVVARDFLVNERPVVTINIVDASNLERNLYLTLQFLELGIPVCIALNMIDVAKNRGMTIDAEKLSRLLAVPVTPVVARSGKGRKELMDAAVGVALEQQQRTPFEISYGEDLDTALAEMELLIVKSQFLTNTYPARWTALKYLEGDEQILGKGFEADLHVAVQFEKIVTRLIKHLKTTMDTYPEALIADHRYGYIHSIMKQGILQRRDDTDYMYLSDRIDKVLTNRLLGPVIMLLVLMGLYQFTFTYSEIPVDWCTNIALVGGFAAKEVIISTLGTAYSLGEVDTEETSALSDTLAASPDWSPVVALSMIVFVMFYSPCFVAVVCVAREAGSWKWGAFSMIFNTVMAFALAVLIYQVGGLL